MLCPLLHRTEGWMGDRSPVYAPRLKLWMKSDRILVEDRGLPSPRTSKAEVYLSRQVSQAWKIAKPLYEPFNAITR
jgi:hypothetical protein